MRIIDSLKGLAPSVWHTFNCMALLEPVYVNTETDVLKIKAAFLILSAQTSQHE